ncbi:MAG: class I SAM-dependent methyltransferase [Planctomycetaceae bacterium]|nr:class I SAM-dependent methyltransferase [Planctomycetales bacterium]MCB9923265.1 class I SAM-dependent methyltransferase [Planctomycetaceae bacterium]
MWLKNRFIQKLGGGWLESFGLRAWSSILFKSLSARKDPEVVRLLRGIHKEKRSLLSAYEQYLVYALAKAQSKKFEGAFAEVGVYKGASAKLLCEVKGNKPLHLFDTFEGLPEASAADRDVHRKGQYAYGLENVQEYLHGYENVHYHKGLFPDSAVDVPLQSYAFAHFDVDLYEGTLACLEYFYPKMVHGGVILSHDYSLLAGVEQAFTEFFADKPEEVIDLPTTQCLVFKL